MGVKVSTYEGVLPVLIKNGQIVFRDLLGRVQKGTLNCEENFTEDSTFFADLLFVNMVQNNKRIVLRYDSTWSLYDDTTKELLDMGVFKMENPEILNTSYEPIGHYIFKTSVATIVLNTENRRLAHVLISDKVEAVTSFAFNKPFNEEVDLVTSQAEAHYYKHSDKSDIFIYNMYGRIRTEGMISEVSRPL